MRSMKKMLFFSIGSLILILALLSLKALLSPSRQMQVSAGLTVELPRRQVVTRLAAAIAIPTVSYGQNEAVAASTFDRLYENLAESFPRVHAQLQVDVVNQHGRLFFWPGGDSERDPILFITHSDVVPVEPGSEERWAYPPFSGEVADGFVWGRGSLDNKCAVLATMEALEHLLSLGYKPDRGVYLAIGHDEEVGGNGGAEQIAALLEARGVRLAFTLDEGSPIISGMLPGITSPVAIVGLAEKGYLSLELLLHVTEAGHAAMPRGDGAIVRLGRALTRLGEHPMPARLQSPANEMIDFLAPEMPFLNRVAMANRGPLSPLLRRLFEAKPATNAMVRTTAAPTIFKAGFKSNALPAQASAIVNFRMLPGDSSEAVIDYVNATIDDPDIIVRRYGDFNEASQVSSCDSAQFSEIQRAISSVFPQVVVVPGLVITGTDSKHYQHLTEAQFRFLPTRLLPTDIKRLHGTNERIAINNYLEIIRFYISLIRGPEQPHPSSS